jgi:PadR family transcriptional regulator, regulatory protein PadR
LKAARLLTDFELLILLAILRIGDEAYGVPIAGEIEAATNRPVTRASIYTALDRLQQMGLVTSEMGDPTPERGGRAKRFFSVTAPGLKAVKEAQRGVLHDVEGIAATERKSLVTTLPRFVTRILDDLGQSHVAGDLAEEVPAAHSAAWVGWQVGAALMRGAVSAFRTHPYLTFRAAAL